MNSEILFTLKSRFDSILKSALMLENYVELTVYNSTFLKRFIKSISKASHYYCIGIYDESFDNFEKNKNKCVTHLKSSYFWGEIIRDSIVKGEEGHLNLLLEEINEITNYIKPNN